MQKKKILVAVAVGLVALEVALQLGVFVMSLVYRAPNLGPRADVVCLGDSYTAGIGASSPEASYPAQLERRLRAAGHDVHVSNGGMPGQDSAFMLQRLPSLLQPETKVLCVLMAFNDTWSRPGRIDLAAISPAAAPAGFQWRWRTGRLVALCVGFAENSWFRTNEQVAAQAPMPRADGKPEELVDVAAGFRQLETLGLTAADEPPPVLPAEADPALRDQLAAIERQIASGAAREALAAAEGLVEDERAHVFAWKLVAIAAHVAGESERARGAFARLAEFATAGDTAALEANLIALLATGRTEDAIVAARSLVEKQPRSLAGWIVLQDATYVLGRTAAFRDVAPRAMRVCGRLLPPQTAAMARHFAEVTAGDDAARAARLLIAACCLDGNAGLARATIASLRRTVPWSHFASALDAADVADERRERWRLLLRAAYDEEHGASPWAATLEDHLLQIGALCRDRGIRLVVLGYPFPHPQLEAVQRAAAGRLGAPFVSVRERFDRELATRAWDDLFVKNGHCNDAGYAIVAELAAAAVVAALAK